MILLSTRGWEELEWILEMKFTADNDSYYQFKLKFKTKFWDRKELLTSGVTGQVADINCEFNQVTIDKRDLNSWLNFLDSLTTKNLDDLKIGTEKEFKLTDKEGEKFKLTISDSIQNHGYNLKAGFTRGRTNLNFEMETDITCLTNYFNKSKELLK